MRMLISIMHVREKWPPVHMAVQRRECWISATKQFRENPTNNLTVQYVTSISEQTDAPEVRCGLNRQTDTQTQLRKPSLRMRAKGLELNFLMYRENAGTIEILCTCKRYCLSYMPGLQIGPTATITTSDPDLVFFVFHASAFCLVHVVYNNRFWWDLK